MYLSVIDGLYTGAYVGEGGGGGVWGFNPPPPQFFIFFSSRGQGGGGTKVILTGNHSIAPPAKKYPSVLPRLDPTHRLEKMGWKYKSMFYDIQTNK